MRASHLRASRTRAQRWRRRKPPCGLNILARTGACFELARSQGGVQPEVVVLGSNVISVCAMDYPVLPVTQLPWNQVQ